MNAASKNLNDLQNILKSDANRNKLISHPVLKAFKEKSLNKDQVSTIVGQWYHPLQNFPFFLSACISHIEITPIQTFISDILHEELGCGDPSESHLDLYISTCEDAGMERDKIVNSTALSATHKLIEGYKKSSKSQNTALGFIYATEVADLAMVSSIGTAIANLCGKSTKDLPWVDIHVQQEPNHVNKAESSLNVNFDEEDLSIIQSSARSMWNLWIDFFDQIGMELFKENLRDSA